jgi:hypothetical protein
LAEPQIVIENRKEIPFLLSETPRLELRVMLAYLLVDASRDPEILAISCRVLLPLALLAAHEDEAALLSSEYSTACSNVIARPSARAASKASSPNWERTAATVLSYGER